MADISIEGLEKMLSSLDNVSDELRSQIWKHVKQSAVNVQTEARNNVPIKTGKLKQSIKVKYDQDALEAVVYTKKFYSRFVEFGTVHSPAQPFMHPALENERDRYLQGLSNVMK